MSRTRETPGGRPGAGARQTAVLDAVSVPQSTPEYNLGTYQQGGASSSSAPTEGDPWAAVPEELKKRNCWVCWHREQRNGKPTKVPYNPNTGRRASVTNPGTWATFTDARAAVGRFDGLGFVLGDGIAGCDLDGCLDPNSGIIDPAAEEVVRALDSYTEASPSGTGLHVLVFGKLPPGGRRNGKLELYDRGRFFCMTGQHLPGTPATVEHRQDALAGLHGRIFGMARDTHATRRAPAPEQKAAPADLGDLSLPDNVKALVAARLEALLDDDTTLRLIAQRKWHNGNDRTASGYDQAFLNRLVLRHGWSAPAELAWAMYYARLRRGDNTPSTWQLKRTVPNALQARPRSELEGGVGIPSDVLDAGLKPGPLALYLVRAEWTVLHGKLPTREQAAAALGKDPDTVRRYYWRPLREAGFSQCPRPREKFTILPVGLASNSHLSPGAKATAAHLARSAGSDGWANIGLVRLCDRVRRKEGAVKGYLRELQRAGYVVAEVADFIPGMGRRLHANRYRFAPVPTAAPAEVQGGAYSDHSGERGGAYSGYSSRPTVQCESPIAPETPARDPRPPARTRPRRHAHRRPTRIAAKTADRTGATLGADDDGQHEKTGLK